MFLASGGVRTSPAGGYQARVFLNASRRNLMFCHTPNFFYINHNHEHRPRRRPLSRPPVKPTYISANIDPVPLPNSNATRAPLIIPTLRYIYIYIFNIGYNNIKLITPGWIEMTCVAISSVEYNIFVSDSIVLSFNSQNINLLYAFITITNIIFVL